MLDREVRHFYLIIKQLFLIKNNNRNNKFLFFAEKILNIYLINNMAKALWEQDITKKTDWGGDDSTGGQAVSGKYVQKFIKETLNKKFGYMSYDKDSRKYLVFADKEDFNLWNASETNHTTYANLVLATFDAPQPATISVGIVSGDNYAAEFETMLFGKKLKSLKFTYYIEDNSGNAVAEAVVLRVTVTSRTTGSVKSDVVTLPIDLQHYKDVDEAGNKIGIAYEYTRLSNLISSADNYDIILTLTGVTTQVSATLAYSLQLIDINISSNFNNLTSIEHGQRMFSQLLTVSGAPTITKILNVYIDGQPLYQDYRKLSSREELTVTSGQDIGSAARIPNKELAIYMMRYENPADTSSALIPVTWEEAPDTNPEIMEQVDPEFIGKEIFSPGKHTLQLNAYIIVDGNKISSKTLFYEFVVADANTEATYLLYKSELSDMSSAGQEIRIEGEQYSPITFSVGVFDTRGREVEVEYAFSKETPKPTDNTQYEWVSLGNPLKHKVQSGSSDEVVYTLRESGNLKMDITSPSATDSLTIYITSSDSGVSISEVTDGNRYRYSAENRSNSEGNALFWPNSSHLYGDNPDFDKQGALNSNIILNKNNGWNDNALILQNGSTVTFPFNLFNMPVAGKEYAMQNDGFTFEIDFETMNVQDDDAPILDFSDDTNTSYLKICATSAEFCSMGGTKIKTNFKEGERIKLAFIVNPLADLLNNVYVGTDITRPEENPSTDENPNTLFIMVNGVLDRVVKYGTGRVGSDSFTWRNPQGPNKNSFSIGNTNGKCGLKLYSIRIYDRNLTLDEEFMNYMNDQSGDKLLEVYRKNNILNANGEISFEECKKVMPTMLLGMDYISFGSFDATRKKDNTFADVQFFDPENNELNFYARQCWVSCQGTSSMSYPIKNLRLYLGKTATKVTFQYKDQIEITNSEGQNEFITIPTQVTNQYHLETKPEFETEFWPFSEYGEANESRVEAWADEVLPYSTNKKADSTDGSAVLVDSNYLTVIHDGYHKIGANKTIKGKAALIRTYAGLTEFDPNNIGENGIPEQMQVSIYRIKEGAVPLLVKDAFDNKKIVYSTPGMEGYLGTGSATNINNATFDSVYNYGDNEISIDLFEDCTDEVKSNKIGSSEETIEDFLTHDDLYISAYRPLLRSGETVLDESYKRYLYELRYSGVKFFTKKAKKKKVTDEEGKDTEVKVKYPNGYQVWQYKKAKALEDGVLYYSLGSNWRQYNGKNGTHNSGWTDRWTLKADYAESSMTHNAGVGRLWGDAMYNVKLDTLGNVCQTNAQAKVAAKPYGIDIRTSCDGKPIVMFYKQISHFNEDGKPVYGDIKFAGLFNIMTDKSSTKLFGFENIKDENDTTIFKASNTECWECLNNGSAIIKGITTAFDEKDESGKTAGVTDKKSELGEDRPLWGTYEARWPDTGQERHPFNPDDYAEGGYLGNNWPDDVYGVDTKNLEGFLRWVNFTQYALNYTIGKNGEMDGYIQDIYKPVTDNPTILWEAYQLAETTYNNAKTAYDAAKANGNKEEMDRQMAIMNTQTPIMDSNRLYRKWEKSGNTIYSAIGETYEYIGKDENDKDITVTAVIKFDTAVQWYTYSWNIDMEVVRKSIKDTKIGKRVYLVNIPSFDSEFRCDDAEGKTVEQEQSKHFVKTYVFASGDGTYEYYDNYGKLQNKIPAAKLSSWDPTFDPANEHKVILSSGAAPVSCANITYMQYFKATKWDHLDVYKVAAYYIYLLRFGAVDQVVKNSMMTTEDGQKYYFINYDNDTILGVRNDGYLIYNWDMDRVTYDASLPGYAFAGSQSVLWNNLEMDDEFMSIVKEIDNAMVSNNLLSAKVVLEYFNEKQEGSWSERLYNEQEKIKYLSTVRNDFSTDRYLGFMHGTRHSHRNWWVNHRWELYDAKWSSGLYSMKQMKFIMTFTASYADPKDIMAITAASKYHFTMVRNTKIEYTDWIKEIASGENGVFTSRTANSVGDPIYVYGPQKIKVLNLRPIAPSISVINIAEPYTITSSTVGGQSKITSDWVADDGTLMTKMLIGNSDTQVSATAVDINGLGKLISLEELDIRGMQKLNGQCPVISELANLHRYRAYNSNTTKFDPAPSAMFYEVSLGDETQAINLDNVTFMADPNSEYVVYQSDIVSGNESVGADLAARVGDYLPDYSDVAEEAYRYCYTVDDENHEMVHHTDYVFRYTPNAELSSVTFKNVVGLDTYQFLLDWDRAKNYTLRPGSVKATGVNWIITDDGEDVDASVRKTAVQKLIDIYDKLFYHYNEEDDEIEGDKDNLKGKVYIKKAGNAALTVEEYNLLIETFGADVFSQEAGLMINCAEGMFVNVNGYTDKKVGETGSLKDKDYYELVQGNTLEINFAVFPIRTDKSYVYYMKYGFGCTNEGTTWPIALTNSTKGFEVYEVRSGNTSVLKLANDGGKATLWANPAFNLATDGLKIIDIDLIEYGEDGMPSPNKNITAQPGKTVHVKLLERVMPTEQQVIAQDAEEVTIPNAGATNTYKVSSSDTQEITIKYNPAIASNVNVKVTEMKVSFGTSTTPQYVLGGTNPRAEIVAYENGEYVSINNDTHEYKFNIKNYIIQYASMSDKKVKVYVTLKYENGETINKTIEYEVVCKPATAVTLHTATYDEETETWTVDENITTNIFIDGKGTYAYKVVLGDTNINYALSLVDLPTQFGWLNISLDGDILNVVSSPTGSELISASQGITIHVKATPEMTVGEFVTAVDTQAVLSADIKYPDKLELKNTDPYRGEVFVNAPGFWTYDTDKKFNVNLTDNKGIETNVAVKLDFMLSSNNSSQITHAGNYPYAIEISNISLKTLNGTEWTTKTTKDNPFETDNYITLDDVTGGSITLSYKNNDVDLSNDVEIEGYEEEGVFHAKTYKSIDGLFITATEVSGKNSEAKVCVSCKVRYDIDTKNINGEVFGKFGREESETVTFEFDVLRSICSATRWAELDDVSTGKYYIVDKNNRFFEIPYETEVNSVGNTVLKTASLDNVSNSGVASSDWLGLGFVQGTHPIFVSFESRYEPLPIANASINGSHNAMSGIVKDLGNTMYTTDPTLFNGYEITSTLYNIAKNNVIPNYSSIIGDIFNESNGQLYVPSMAEINQLITEDALDGGTLTTGHLAALNIIMNALTSKNIVYTRKYNSAITARISDDAGVNSNYFDLYKNIQLFASNDIYVNYLTSTLEVTERGGVYCAGIKQGTYNTSDYVSTLTRYQNMSSTDSSVWHVYSLVIIPFVHVQ